MDCDSEVVNGDISISQVVTLYALGSNGSGQLGVGHFEDLHIPGILKESTYKSSLWRVRGDLQVAAGGNHTIFTSDCGKRLWRTGYTVHDDAHIECVEPVDIPSQSDADETSLLIGGIAATWNAISAIYDGAVWVMGSGNSGELGLGRSVTKADHLTRIPEFPPAGVTVVAITASLAHVVARLSNGEVWGWGNGRKGQLGLQRDVIWSPQKIEGIPFPVSEAVCGKDFTCVVSESQHGQLLMLGALGKDRFSVMSSAPPAVPGWTKITASWGSVFVLLRSGQIISWGRDDHGQLPPPGLPIISDIAAGSEHCIALTAATPPKVLAWGWGEHGNCSFPIDCRGDVKGRWNTISVPNWPCAVFGGCATTFIAVRDRVSDVGEPH